jgi:homoaconitase/3-isopropylmalate dehydratase large subunit
MLASTTNPVLTNLRRTARILGKPQSAVAANWLNTPAKTRPYSTARHLGMTRAQYNEGQSIIRRLAECAR